jgi:tRNA(Ile)-lysidine synthase
MNTSPQTVAVNKKFLLRMEQFIRRHDLFHPGNHLILGVSGGLDSMVMLDAFCELRERWCLSLSIAHVNFHLRGKESDADERFVLRVAKKYGLPVHVRRADTKMIAAARKESIQVVARELRYTFFSALAQDLGADKIAVAHNAQDNAETMLFNFFRGSGIQGLSGIQLSTPNGIVRPLQFATREEITAYAKAKRLKHREDSSNKSIDYTRNFLRHKIIPAIEKRVNAALVKTLNTEAAIFGSCSDYLDELVSKLEHTCFTLTDTGCTLSLKHFRAQHVFIQHLLVRHSFLVLGIEPNFVHIEEIVRLLQSQTGKTIDCGNGFFARRSAASIEIGKSAVSLPYLLTVDAGQTVRTDEFTLSVRKHPVPKIFRRDPLREFIDADTVVMPLTVRTWQPGDAFVPLGMKAKKKLSDFFVDQKIARSIKQSVPVVLSGGMIVWVAGLRLDERCRVTKKTTSVYKLSIKFQQ